MKRRTRFCSYSRGLNFTVTLILLFNSSANISLLFREKVVLNDGSPSSFLFLVDINPGRNIAVEAFRAPPPQIYGIVSLHSTLPQSRHCRQRSSFTCLYSKSLRSENPQQLSSQLNKPRSLKSSYRNKWKRKSGRSSFQKHPRSLLNTFEDICQRKEANLFHDGDFINVLSSMVDDSLKGKNRYSGKEKISRAHSYLPKESLLNQIVPTDASSLIRLLGRHGAYDAMLRFCRQFCRDIVKASVAYDCSSKDSRNSFALSRSDADRAILFAYTAAIAACSKPPQTSVATAKDQNFILHSQYRSKSSLLSLLKEMEFGYGGDGEQIRPSSFTLTAVLLGIDGGSEALEVLAEFEKKYGQESADGVSKVDVTRNQFESQTDRIMTVHVYNAALSACSRHARREDGGKGKQLDGWQVALMLLQKMRRRGPLPNEQTYVSFLQVCAKYGQVKVALSLLEEVQQSSTIKLSPKIYLPLLKASANVGNAQLAENLIKNMNAANLKCTTQHMNLYLLALAKCKKKAKALRVLNNMMELKKENPSLIPDLCTLNTVLSACAQDGDFESAQSLLNQMKEGKLIFSMWDNGAQTQSEPIIIRPDVVSYNTVISCADPQTALDLILEMRLSRRNREGVVLPNSVTYTNAITRCRSVDTNADSDSRENALEIALTLLNLARDSALNDSDENINLNVYIYSAAIWAAESVGNYHVAVQLLREMSCPPNNISYDGVISALSQRGLYREVLYFYYEMQSLGLQATRKTYQKLVFAIKNARDPDLFASPRKKAALFEGVLSGMPERDRQVKIGGPLFESLIRAHGDDSEPGASYGAARMTFNSIVGPVDDFCLSAILAVCSSTKPPRWEEALTLLHSSDIIGGARGPGKVTCRALSSAVIACAKADCWHEALNLLELYGSEVQTLNQNISSHQESERKMDTNQGGMVSIAAINFLIRACGRSSRADLAVQLLNDMSIKYGVDPDEKSYRFAIIACNQAEHREAKARHQNTESFSVMPGTLNFTWWECALSLLRRMKEGGLEPDSQTYSSVVSACEAAGQWQRAVGVLQSMPSFSHFLCHGRKEGEESYDPPNLYCLNAAISACEKGGAWVEAVQLYEHIRSQQKSKKAIQPNFITVNSLLIALERANQIELAETIYKEAVRDHIVSPWKRRYDKDGIKRKMMDLHQFSAPMAKIAVRSYMESLLLSKRPDSLVADVVLIVGKGRGSEGRPVLLPTIMKLLEEEFNVNAVIDYRNTGRIQIFQEDIATFIRRKSWKM